MQFIGNGVRGGERVFNTAHHRGFSDEHCDLKCPRCGCLNTKFCYYNNYNLSQPRFFCKGCRRYWTKGGVLRNVPVGGSTRKTKPSKKKTGTKKPTNSQNSSCSSSISPETTSFTPNEALPTTTLFNHGSCEPQMVTENMHQLFSEMGTFRSLMTLSTDELPIVFSSAPEPEILQLTQQRDRDKVVETQNWEDWGMFDQSYWLNNTPDHQLNYLL